MPIVYIAARGSYINKAYAVFETQVAVKRAFYNLKIIKRDDYYEVDIIFDV